MKKIIKNNFSVYIHKPFTIFEIEDFLPDEQFFELLNSFPAETNFQTETNNIKTFSNKSEQDTDNFNKFLKSNQCWDNFLKKLNQKILLIQRFIPLFFLT